MMDATEQVTEVNIGQLKLKSTSPLNDVNRQVKVECAPRREYQDQVEV